MMSVYNDKVRTSSKTGNVEKLVPKAKEPDSIGRTDAGKEGCELEVCQNMARFLE